MGLNVGGKKLKKKTKMELEHENEGDTVKVNRTEISDRAPIITQ